MGEFKIKVLKTAETEARRHHIPVEMLRQEIDGAVWALGRPGPRHARPQDAAEVLADSGFRVLDRDRHSIVFAKRLTYRPRHNGVLHSFVHLFADLRAGDLVLLGVSPTTARQGPLSDDDLLVSLRAEDLPARADAR
jgi:hypothetical protein